jgi:diphthamide synthase (EF-2-diphthine--ammonia ligase)
VEIYAVELVTKLSKLIILSLYRAPTGNFNQFIKNLDYALKHLYKHTVELLICGDIKTDYLIKTTKKDNWPLY